MVGEAVNVKWFVVWFSVRFVSAVSEVECYVKEVIACLVGWLVSAVILSPSSLKVCERSFLVLLQSLPDLVLSTAKPSSRYRPTFFPNSFCTEFKINRPTSSDTSAPSKNPIVTSKMLSVLRFDHVWLSWKRTDFRACFIIVMSSSDIVVNCLAHAIDLSRSCSEIEG